MRRYLRQLYDGWLGPDSMVDPTMRALEDRGLVRSKPPGMIKISNGYTYRRVKREELVWALTGEGEIEAKKLIVAKRNAAKPKRPTPAKRPTRRKKKSSWRARYKLVRRGGKTVWVPRHPGR